MLVDAVRYLEGRRVAAGALHDVVEAGATGDGGFVWAGLHDPQPDEVDEVARVFGLHPLAVEDAIKASQRPKVERYGDWIFVVLRTARYLDEPEEIDVGEIQIFVAHHAVVVIRHGEPVPLTAVRARLEASPDHLAAGPIAVVHAVIDEVVDQYQTCLVGLDDDVSEVELDVFADGGAATRKESRAGHIVERIYFLQREILELHRAITPLATAIPAMRHDPLLSGNPEWDAYFRDVEDHLHRHGDGLTTLRELLAAALSANATQMSLRQNEDMRKISAWVAIAAVPTMVAGIYGMNFEHMPELEWIAGYPVALGAMLAVCTVLYRKFRTSGWL